MFTNLLSALHLQDDDAGTAQQESAAESKAESSHASGKGPHVSFWGVAAAVAGTVRATADDFVKTVQHTDWQSELKALGKEVAHDTKSIASNAVNLVDQIPRHLDGVSDKAYLGEEEQHISSPVENAAVAAKFEQVGSVLANFGRTLVSGTQELVEQVRDAVETEIVGVPLNEQRPSRSRGTTSSSHLSTSTGKYNRFEAEVSAMQRDSSTYCDEPEDKEDFAAWRQTFKLQGMRSQIDKIVKQNAFMAELQSRIVPLIVEYEDFWTRYFYRLHKLQQKEAQRQELHNRMAKQADLEVGWDDDDITSPPAGNARAEPSQDHTTAKPAGSTAAKPAGSTAAKPAGGAAGASTQGKDAVSKAKALVAAPIAARIAALNAASSATPAAAPAPVAAAAAPPTPTQAPAAAGPAAADAAAGPAAAAAAVPEEPAARTTAVSPSSSQAEQPVDGRAVAATPTAAALPAPSPAAAPAADTTSSGQTPAAAAQSPAQGLADSREAEVGTSAPGANSAPAAAAALAAGLGSAAAVAAADGTATAPVAAAAANAAAAAEEQEKEEEQEEEAKDVAGTAGSDAQPGLTAAAEAQPSTPHADDTPAPAPTESAADVQRGASLGIEQPSTAAATSTGTAALEGGAQSEAAAAAAAAPTEDAGAQAVPAAADSAEGTPDNHSDATSPEWCVVSNASASDVGASHMDAPSGEHTPPPALSETHEDEADDQALPGAATGAGGNEDDSEEVDEDWGNWD